MTEGKVLVCPSCKNPLPIQPDIEEIDAEPPNVGTQIKCPSCGYEGFPEEVTKEELKKLTEE